MRGACDEMALTNLIAIAGSLLSGMAGQCMTAEMRT
jgi:hypothetical protein